jgi:hypothetical protein
MDPATHKTPRENVRKVSPEKLNRKIDQKTSKKIAEYRHAGNKAITARIIKLEKEWDIERLIEIIMSVAAIAGIVRAFFSHPYWLLLPVLALILLIQHAVQGWCPPVPLLRWAGVRTKAEIDREKFALKVIRGDFRNMSGQNSPEEVFDAVMKVKEEKGI